jgi:ubiquinone/menaquinone biosynthesis C-methylase UbiE
MADPLECNAEMSLEQQRAWWNGAATSNAANAVLSDRQEWDSDSFYASGRDWLAQHFAFGRFAAVEFGGKRALDFGCGLGRMTVAISEFYEEVIGIDISEEMLDRARKAVTRPGISFNHVTTYPLPFESESIDLVYSTIVLQHISPPHNIQYLKELFRVLKVGGLLLFDAPAASFGDDGTGIFILPRDAVLSEADTQKCKLLALRNFPATSTQHYQYLFQKA